MDILIRDDVRSLMTDRSKTCVSIYMPTERGDSRQNPIRFKTLLGGAEKNYQELTSDTPKGREAFFAQARELLERDTFWKHQSDGFCLFLSDDLFRYFRLPIPFDELAVVSERFHLKPLLPFLSNDHRFFVLALSQKNVRLLRCTRQRAEELAPEDMPASLQEALAHDVPQKQLQYYAQGGGGQRPTDVGGAIYHGHGVGHDDAKNAILRFFQSVDDGLHEVLRDETAPLVLAGVEMLIPIFKEASNYANILDETVPGNPDELSAADLRKKAWEIVADHFEKDRSAAVAAYMDISRTDRASSDLRQVVPASHHGRVDLLFVPEGRREWGLFDPEADSLTLHEEQLPGDEDLLDFAAVHTWLNGGTVYVVPAETIPGNGLLASRFRY